MEMLKLFLFFLFATSSIVADAKSTDSLILRGIVPPQFSIKDGNFQSTSISKNLVVFNGDTKKFSVKKIKAKNQIFIEVTFH